MKKIMAMALLVLIITGVTGCMGALHLLDSSQSQEIEQRLEEKYGEKFVVERIGDRLDTGFVKAVCRPANREDLFFYAKLYNESKELTDGYAYRRVTRMFADIVVDEFSKYGFKAQATFGIFGGNNITIPPDISFGEYLEKAKPERIVGDIIIEEGELTYENSKELEAALMAASKASAVEIRATLTIVPEKHFKKYTYEWLSEGRVYDIIKQYGPFVEFHRIANENGITEWEQQ
jgi:hypothetical protein